jgi:formylglycine-generating enzyme required for sulfatase activity
MGHALRDRRFSDALEGVDLKLGPMTSDELRQAIVGPAQATKVRLDDGLAERIVTEVGQEPGNLPLMEFAMERLWNAREGRRLTHAAYEHIGGIERALTQYADSVLEPMSGEERDRVQRIFLRLVCPGTEETGHTRRTAHRSEFSDADWPLVVRLADKKLVVTGRAAGSGEDDARTWETLDVIHESLIRHWPSLQKWIDTNRDFLAWLDRVRRAAADWKRGQGEFLRGPRLGEAIRRAGERQGDLGPNERAFIEASLRARRIRRVIGAASTVMLAAGVVIAVWIGFDVNGSARASSLVDSFATADTRDVPRIIEQLAPYWRWARPRLVAMANESEPDSKKRLHASLALLPEDPDQVDYLRRRLLTADPVELLVIRNALEEYRASLVGPLRAELIDGKGDPEQRFRAACALAAYDGPGQGQSWEELSPFIVSQLLRAVLANPNHYEPLVHLLRPIRAALLGQLAMAVRDDKRDALVRTWAATVLADYASGMHDILADILMDAEEKQFPPLFEKLRQHKGRAVALLEAELEQRLPEGSERDHRAKRQARAAVALIRLGEPERAWPLLRHSPDPRVRSYIVNWLKPLGAEPKSLVPVITRATPHTPSAQAGGQLQGNSFLFDEDKSVRRAAILALGEFPAVSLVPEQKKVIVEKLLDLYRTDPDAGVHAAAEWTLKQWKEEEMVSSIEKALVRLKRPGDRRWFVNAEGQTFAVINGPVVFRMGSPPNELGRDPDEAQHSRRIPRGFAISTKEVTVEQYERFIKADSKNQSHDVGDVTAHSPDRQGPQVNVSWFDAVAYCNWLSEQEGLEPCYQRNIKGEYAEGMKVAVDFLQRSGYRLPTEAEWEYACRAGTITSRYYGASIDLLEAYAWYFKNSDGRAAPCGTRKPNDFGLFDMLGSIYEWTHDEYVAAYPQGTDEQPSDDTGQAGALTEKSLRVIRGGTYMTIPRYVRTADRSEDPASFHLPNSGFRVVRTCR